MNLRAVIIAAFVTTIIPAGTAQAVALQQGTATFSQTFGHNFYPAEAIDGILQTSSSSTFNGWAIFSGSTSAQTFATETVNDITTPHVEIKLHFNHDRFFSGSHLIGRFRISVTDDDRALFCDGLPSGGDVDANWTVVTPSAVTLPSGMTYSLPGDGSFLVSGTIPQTAGNGFDVTLSSSGPQVMVPSVVTFNYGGRSKTFTINTLVVSATVVKVITATRNGRTRTVTITVTRA